MYATIVQSENRLEPSIKVFKKVLTTTTLSSDTVTSGRLERFHNWTKWNKALANTHLKWDKAAMAAKEQASIRLPSLFRATTLTRIRQHLCPDIKQSPSISMHFDSRMDLSNNRTISTLSSSRPRDSKLASAMGDKSTETLSMPSDGRLGIGSAISAVTFARTRVLPSPAMHVPYSRP